MRGLREKLMVKPKIAFSHTFRSTSFNFPKVGNKDKEGLFWKYEIEWLLLKMVTSLCFTVQPRSIPSRISARIMFHVFESTRYVCFSIKNFSLYSLFSLRKVQLHACTLSTSVQQESLHFSSKLHKLWDSSCHSLAHVPSMHFPPMQLESQP